jgi:hypothetical protein
LFKKAIKKLDDWQRSQRKSKIGAFFHSNFSKKKMRRCYFFPAKMGIINILAAIFGAFCFSLDDLCFRYDHQ